MGRGRVKDALDASNLLFDLFQGSGLKSPSEDFDYSKILKGLSKEARASLTAAGGDAKAAALLKRVAGSGGKSVFIEFVREAAGGNPSCPALLAAIWATLGWEPLIKRSISRITFAALPWYSRIFSSFVGCSAPAARHGKDSFWGVKNEELIDGWTFTDAAFLALIGGSRTSMRVRVLDAPRPHHLQRARHDPAQGCKGG